MEPGHGSQETTMVIGVLRLAFHLPTSDSLKAKRRIVRPLAQQIQTKFRVSVAEIEDQDIWQVAVLGCACVSSDGQHADAMLARIADFAERHPEAVLTDYQTELIHAF